MTYDEQVALIKRVMATSKKTRPPTQDEQFAIGMACFPGVAFNREVFDKYGIFVSNDTLDELEAILGEAETNEPEPT